ncbi:uncharacterized protein DNG_04617 [Cephalotrichum gorgonifer]|uniref:Uncharacterized protein n=1 Tax=Cephalotrichum gorgonifer TaxID=2041049 RepID=A0AAE8MYG6_9PEZI|nr:uncharacterized protein DNG_04617 [Cephalotrichum gorgonifer]
MFNFYCAITTVMRKALLETFEAAARLVSVELRPQLILVGGAASIEAVQVGALHFTLDLDGAIAFHCSAGFIVHIDLIEIGAGSNVIEKIHAAEPLLGASVASKPDLLYFRAVTVVDRWDDGDVLDFLWLLYRIAEDCEELPALGDQELGIMVKAGARLGIMDHLLLAAIVGGKDETASFRILQIE